jgi:neurotransmitter:Na+ symporter, NSS family
VGERWSSRFGFILAATGSAVGIGNIWRFSAVVGESGGGAYLLPYFVAVVLFGAPLMMLEFSIGRHYRADLVSAFKRVSRRFEILGWIIATIVFTILSYYLVITGWTLAFLVMSSTGVAQDFDRFTGGMWPVFSFAACALVTGLIVAGGVRAGIERLATIVMPLAFVILAALALYAVTVDGWGEAVDFLFTPDMARLSEPGIWSAAIGQAFFSLSVGFGVLLTYGAYLDDEVDIVRSTMWIAGADVLVALLAGMVIFPIVFTHGLEPTVGAELAFTTLPAAFDLVPGGTILAPAFFLLLFLAAITSAVSIAEMNVAAVRNATSLTRRQTAAILTGLVFLLGLPSALSYSSVNLEVFGWRVLDLLDDTVGTMGLPIAGLIIVLVFTRHRVMTWLPQQLETATHAARLWLVPNLRYVVPVVLAVVTVSRIALDIEPLGWQWFPDFEELGRFTQLALTVVLLAVLTAMTIGVIRVLRLRWAAWSEDREEPGPDDV